MAQALNLYEALTRRGRVIRQGELVQIVIDGGGAMVAASADFRSAQKWAQTKPASGNVVSDRGRFFERIEALVSRPGSMLPTRGNRKQIEHLARLMKQGGYDLGEWMLPAEIKQLDPAANTESASTDRKDNSDEPEASAAPGDERTQQDD